ncbi:MAG: YraN family protein [Alphaproteobacteria bacterium]|nr:YraN family protein [Alphaproteobacteria bacterium]
MKRTAYQTGLSAERKCRWALRLKGYGILAERYKTPVGEIDLVAARGKTLIAVEVKARATQEAALESIQPRQQARIAHALEYFVMNNPRFSGVNLRFDVMLVAPGRWPRHMENAWGIDD